MAGRTMRYSGLATVAPLVCFLAPFGVVSAWAQTTNEGQPSCPSPPSTLPLMTYDEDVRYLENPACRTGFLDSLQFISLRSEGEDYYLSLGGWIRERGEYVSNPNWSSSPPGNIYPMQRYFLHMDLHLDERFRFFGELASSLVNGRNGGPRPGVDEETMYVHQAFVDLGLWNSGHDSLTLRAGRQEAALGSENLVSTRDGRNIRRSLDGARLSWVHGDWTVDAFALKPTRDNSGYFNDPPNHAASFCGVYAVRPFGILPKGHVDLYYMGLDNQNVPFDGKGSGREQRQTIGTRLWGTTGHWDYNNEFTFRFGSFGHDAFGPSPLAAIKIRRAELSARLTLFTRKALISAMRNYSPGEI